jgi:LemA protein
MEPLQLVILALVLALAIWALLTYNALVRRRNEIGNAFAQIDVQLKRRFDLVPNLVETASRYLQHERQTLEAVAQARAGAGRAADAARGHAGERDAMQALSAADGALGQLLGRLMVVVEAYPALKADARMAELSEELAHTENRIAFARQAFNDAVLDYNNAAQQAPANLVAGLFGFRAAAMLEATDQPAQREAPRVRF